MQSEFFNVQSVLLKKMHLLTTSGGARILTSIIPQGI